MKIAFDEFESVIKIVDGKVNTLIIENPSLLRKFLLDIKNQINGNNGSVILSKDNSIISVPKNLELITDVLLFDINKKSLLNKINSYLNDIAVSSKYYVQSQNIISKIEDYFYSLSEECSCGFGLSKISISSIIKMAGIIIDDQYENDLERILDYMLLVREFDQDKLFVLVSVRNYFDDELIQRFFESIVAHDLKVLTIETIDKTKLMYENKKIIDYDRCEIY